MKDQLELLIEFTKDEDARSRATAIAGLAKIGDPRGFASVLVALFDPVDEVRMTAATALSVFKDERAFEPLAACLDDECEQVAVNCVWALGQVPGPKPVEQLVAVAADASKPANVRTAAVTALGERAALEESDIIKYEQLTAAVREALMPLLSSADNELRATSVWALGHLPHNSKAVAAFIYALDDPYEWVVKYAIEALANAGDPAGEAPLRTLLDDKREGVAKLAGAALEKLASA